MGIEINRTRRHADGSVSCEVVFPNVASYARATNELLQIEPRAFSHAEQVHTIQAYSQAQSLTLRRVAAEMATGRRIPRATVAGGFMSLDDEEPPLRAGEALQDIKAGGTD